MLYQKYRLMFAGILAATLFLSFFPAVNADTIKIGAFSSKTVLLAGGSTVTFWLNVKSFWVKQVNDSGGIKLKKWKSQN